VSLHHFKSVEPLHLHRPECVAEVRVPMPVPLLLPLAEAAAGAPGGRALEPRPDRASRWLGGGAPALRAKGALRPYRTQTRLVRRAGTVGLMRDWPGAILRALLRAPCGFEGRLAGDDRNQGSGGEGWCRAGDVGQLDLCFDLAASVSTEQTLDGSHGG
jgi:hypothetical protein